MFKDENRHYSLRKLSVGLASVLIGISFASSMNSSSVKADTVESGSNSVQTVVKGSDVAIKTDAKDDANAIESNTESADEASKKDSNAIAQDIKQKATEGNILETAMKNVTDGSQIAAKSTLKGSVNTNKDDSSNVSENGSLTAKNNAVKDTVESAKQGSETPSVSHDNNNETTLNVKGSEVKGNQVLVDSAKNNLKMATLMTTTGKKFNTKMLYASKVVSPVNDTNGGFDSSWGKLNVNDWKGSVQGDYYQLNNYTGGVNQVKRMLLIFDGNISSIQTKTIPAKRVINFIYPTDYTGKKQDSIIQTVDVPQKVNVELTTNAPKPSNNILDWVTKTETPDASDPVYFQDYTVPEIKGLLEPDQTVISRQQADITKPINVTVTYRLVDSNTNDAFALDPKNGLHEHANVNNNGGYDEDYWGKLNINDWNYTTNDNTITITGYKGNNQSSLIIPNGADFDLANGQGAKQSNVEISSSVMHDLAKNATRIGLSKTANKKVIAKDAIWSDAFGGMTNKPGTDSNADGGIKYGSPNLTQMDLHNLDTAAITDMGALFNGGSNLTTVGDLSDWNTSNVANMRDVFQTASSLTNIGALSKWDTGKVTDMSCMFSNATSLINIGNLDNWDTSKVTDMHYMFGTDPGKQSHLTNIGDLSKWQTGKVTDMNNMFANATGLTNIGNLDNWNTSNVTNMSWMFSTDSDKQSHLTNIGNLDNWDTSQVTNMAGMFANAANLTNIGDLSKWQTGKVTDMNNMFANATGLTNIGNLDNWNTSKVTNMLGMFGDTNALRHLNISNWNLTKLANKDSMQYMFTEDPNLTVIANDLKLPTWYENEVNNADYFWNNHIAVITNVPELIKATGDINNLKIDDQDASRSIFYDSKGSSDAVQVLKDANNQYIADYHKVNPTKVLKLADTVDQNDPIALANASFITVPAAVGLTVHFEDADPNVNKDSDTVKQELAKTVELSGHSGDTADLSQVRLPTNFELSGDLPSATFGDTDSVTIQLKHKTETSVESLPATRTINVHLPNGTTKVYEQIIGYQRDMITDLVTKTVTRSTWTVNDVISSFTIDGVKQLEHSYVLRNGNYNFAGIKLPKVPGYKAKVSRNNGLLLVSYLALAPEKPEINTNLNDQFSNNLAVNSTVKSDLIVKSDMYQVVNDNHNWQLPVIKNYELKFATNKNQIIFAYTKDKRNNYRFVLTFKDGQYRLVTFDKENKLLKTYSIKSYDELAKIIHSLVLMNIA